MEIFLTLVSAAAFAAFILCFALLSASSAGAGGVEASPCFCRARRNSARLSALCALAAFYFVPAGSLPPFVSCGWGGFAAVGLLVSSALFDARRGPLVDGAAVKALGFAAFFCAAWGLLALFVSRAGVPGSLGCLGTYSVMPLWDAAGIWGRAGMFFLMLLLLTSLPVIPRLSEDSRRFAETRAAELRSLLCAALAAALLLPWNFSAFVETGVFAAFFFDFIFFWAKVFALLRAAELAARCAAGFSRRRAALLRAAFLICGAACIAAETGIF